MLTIYEPPADKPVSTEEERVQKVFDALGGEYGVKTDSRVRAWAISKNVVKLGWAMLECSTTVFDAKIPPLVADAKNQSRLRIGG